MCVFFNALWNKQHSLCSTISNFTYSFTRWNCFKNFQIFIHSMSFQCHCFTVLLIVVTPSCGVDKFIVLYLLHFHTQLYNQWWWHIQLCEEISQIKSLALVKHLQRMSGERVGGGLIIKNAVGGSRSRWNVLSTCLEREFIWCCKKRLASWSIRIRFYNLCYLNGTI